MTLQSVVRAHEDLSEGRISVSHGELLHANINRSPTAYLRNPEQERARSVIQHVYILPMYLRTQESKTLAQNSVYRWYAIHIVNLTHRYSITA